jgi:uncharacterized protein YhaN
LQDAREKAALQTRAEKALEQAGAVERAAAEQAATEATALTALCAEAAFSGDAQVFRERLRQRETLCQAIDSELTQLARLTGGAEESVLRAEAQGRDPEAAQIRLAELDQHAADQSALRDALIARRSADEAELARWRQGAGAEDAIFARESAKAEMEEQGRRWAVLKLASLLVEAGLSRHRARRKDPLLTRAGAIFHGLTESRYDGLDQDFGEDDHLHLRARRADGEALALAALSEGARDQLYLALRLAFLEDYAARSEAPPFVGDDLFASFDDARVAAGLNALAEASGSIQPILFTHHAHIVEIAGARLGTAAQILRLG